MKKRTVAESVDKKFEEKSMQFLSKELDIKKSSKYYESSLEILCIAHKKGEEDYLLKDVAEELSKSRGILLSTAKCYISKFMSEFRLWKLNNPYQIEYPAFVSVSNVGELYFLVKFIGDKYEGEDR